MKEQKLFFTRNGEYNLWEKLIHLSEEHLNQLVLFVLRKRWKDEMPGETAEYASFVYRVCADLQDEDANELINEIDRLFRLMEPPKSDFNATMYHYSGSSLDVHSAVANLQLLQDKLEEKGFTDIKVEIFERYNPQNIIDIRFRSKKSLFFKQNRNDQICNTEIRTYLDFNVALMTEFSNFTHPDSYKRAFITETIRSISSSTEDIQPAHLSDQILRNMLMVESKPSKFKLEVEGKLRVGVDIHNPEEFPEAIYQQEIKKLYERFPLSQVRVCLPPIEEGKLLTVDGQNGKVISRAQNLDFTDIDRFVETLSVSLRYDYLNREYCKELLNAAKIVLKGTFIEKEQAANACYSEIEQKLIELCDDPIGVYVKLARNCFLYCLIKKILLTIDTSNTFVLNASTVSYLAKITGNHTSEINSTFCTVVTTCLQNKTDPHVLLAAFDSAIKQRLVRHVVGI